MCSSLHPHVTEEKEMREETLIALLDELIIE